MTQTKKRPTKRAALKALAVLIDYGKEGFCPTATVGIGEALGMALYSLNDAPTVVDLATEALEQWNGHLSVAAIQAIERGRGEVKRVGRTLTIILPEWWEYR